ncbi:uncharacterized protein [Mytilus edulis]|uniref:uncharacterized protein n=1 Tax=Mytilus edulis TaxID=6550 RepID=UPI0039EF0642
MFQMKDKNKENKNSRDRVKKHLVLTKRLWIFLVLGAVVSILGLIVGGIYFNIQSVTTSSDLTEILPTYILCLLVVVTGVLIITLFWRRYIIQVVSVIVVSIGTGTLCVVISILTGTHILKPLTSLESCDYSITTSICSCLSLYKRDSLELEYSKTDKTRVNFARTSSCKAIQEVLPALLYTEIGLFLAVLCLCALTIVLAYLVLRTERTRLRLLQEETYDEIFTVSGSSSVSDSDDDNIGNQTAVNDLHSVIGQNSEPISSFPISILKSTDRQNSLDSSRSHGKSVDSERSNELLLRNLNLPGVRRSRSCDSLDDIDKTRNLDNNLKQQKGQGKLKEHRKKGRRAVTLNNLDTKQLMLILDLHKKYAEETEILKSQGNLNKEEKPKFDNRRALTPQPYVKQNTIPKIIRSHTPQPYQINHSSSFKKNQGEKKFKEEIKELFLQQSERLKADLEKVKNKDPVKSGSKSVPSHKQTIDVNSNSLFDPVYGVNMNKQQRSRPSVQSHFLPTEPIRRQNADKLMLPPEPLTRQSSHGDTLPPKPLQRDGSAFYVVGSQLDLSQNAKGLKTPGEIRCEKAIQENFKLCKKSDENPYATPRKDLGYQKQYSEMSNNRPSQEELANWKGHSSPEILPPYPHPPSYSDFVSISQDSSSVRTDSQSDTCTYETMDHGKSESSDVPNESRDRLLTGSSDDDVFVSESQKPPYNQTAKKRNMPKMGVSAELRLQPRTNYQSPFHHLNHNHVYDSSNPYHSPSSVMKPNCVQVGNVYHTSANIYHTPQEMPYRVPRTPVQNYHRFPESPYVQPNPGNFHYYEEIDNIETSFMYSEDMLPSNSSTSSQAALFPSNNLTNKEKGLKPYRPITTVDANGEALETMI